MKWRHQMPFGAELRGDAAVRFRLWAPTARRVELCLEHAAPPESLLMAEAGDGWFELATRAAAAGTRYRFRVGCNQLVPDPASRFNPQDVHGPSEVIDPTEYDWGEADWQGRPWHEAVIYELHVGAFTPEGTFRAAAGRLPYLRGLGITAIELMPVTDFPGMRNWGYDGVLPFAPDSRYGRPNDLKYLIDCAHHHGLMVLLDVVYNHFGPEGNYLHAYAERFFSGRHHTPWGAAINFDGEGSRKVRDFVIHNALYWLEEFRFDGLRLDAVHAIRDDSRPDILVELAEAVRRGPGRTRHVHLVLENDDNAAHYLERQDGRARWYDAQWNDDVHHVLHVLLTGERDGYYADYADQPQRLLGRSLAQGFAYQGERSLFRGRPRGEPSRQLPPTAFVAFLQNHDQIGNRAQGERAAVLASPDALRAGFALLLLAPSIPLMFMGEEFGCKQPFLFFCDFAGKLGCAVSEGRRKEFAKFARFHDAAVRRAIPDPNAAATFAMSRIDWDRLREREHAAWLAFVKELLSIRQIEIIPRLPGLVPSGAEFEVTGATSVYAEWRCTDRKRLAVAANLSSAENALPRPFDGRVIYATRGGALSVFERGSMPPWSVVWGVRTETT